MQAQLLACGATCHICCYVLEAERRCLPAGCAAGAGGQRQRLPSACGTAACGGAFRAAAAGSSPIWLARVWRRMRGMGCQHGARRSGADFQCSAGAQPQLWRTVAAGAVCVWRRGTAAATAAAPLLAARHDGVRQGMGAGPSGPAHVALNECAYWHACIATPLYISSAPASCNLHQPFDLRTRCAGEQSALQGLCHV